MDRRGRDDPYQAKHLQKDVNDEARVDEERVSDRDLKESPGQNAAGVAGIIKATGGAALFITTLFITREFLRTHRATNFRKAAPGAAFLFEAGSITAGFAA